MENSPEIEKIEIAPAYKVHFAEGDQGLRQLATYLAQIEKITPSFSWDFSRVLYFHDESSIRDEFGKSSWKWDTVDVDDPLFVGKQPKVKYCNTAGCAVGWMSVASPLQFSWRDNWTEVRDHFDLEDEYMQWLFAGDGYKRSMDDVTPAQVAFNIMAYVNEDITLNEETGQITFKGTDEEQNTGQEWTL